MSESSETFDLVIVGSGGGSMCAALVAKSVGKSVLILEKTQYIGGTTSRSGGAMWMPNNHFMAEDGIADSAENAMLYLDNVVGDELDTRGATRERRRAYVMEAPSMLKFLISEGIKMYRYPYWPDYYDDREGGLKHGRVVIADLFNVNELGKDKDRLRPNYIPFPAKLEEVMQAPLTTRTWKAKRATMKIGLRMFQQKVLGKKWIGAGAALQGRMFQRSLAVGVDIRDNAAVERLLSDHSGRVTGVQAKVG